MNLILRYFLFLILTSTLIPVFSQQNNEDTMKDYKESFYQYSATALDGSSIPMENYKGKVVLVVNTASECGFTPQYAGLEKLHKEYADKGLAVLGFPCNQFGKQEPGDSKEISSFCQLNYGVSFQMFSKIDVNGDDAHVIYKFLKDQKGGILGKRIKWNFTKFLLDRNGNVIERYASTTKPESIEKDIIKLL